MATLSRTLDDFDDERDGILVQVQRVSVPQNFESHVTKFAPRKAP